MIIVLSAQDYNFMFNDYDESIFESNDTVIVANSSERSEEHERYNPHFYYETEKLEDPEQAKLFFERCFKKFGKIDAFINNSNSTEYSTQSIDINKRIFFAAKNFLASSAENSDCLFINITSSRQLLEETKKTKNEFQSNNITYVNIDGRISEIKTNYKIQTNGSIAVSDEYNILVGDLISSYRYFLRYNAKPEIYEEEYVKPVLKEFSERIYQRSEEYRTSEKYFSLSTKNRGVSLPIEQPLTKFVVIYSNNTQKIDQLTSQLTPSHNVVTITPSDSPIEDIIWDVITKEKQYISTIICDNPDLFVEIAKHTAPDWTETKVLDIQKF